MKLKDNTTLSIAAAVSDVVEGKVKKGRGEISTRYVSPRNWRKESSQRRSRA